MLPYYLVSDASRNWLGIASVLCIQREMKEELLRSCLVKLSAKKDKEKCKQGQTIKSWVQLCGLSFSLVAHFSCFSLFHDGSVTLWVVLCASLNRCFGFRADIRCLYKDAQHSWMTATKIRFWFLSFIPSFFVVFTSCLVSGLWDKLG